MKKIIFAFFIFATVTFTAEKDMEQTIRGAVTDKTTGSPLPSANIVIVGTDPLLGASTDTQGHFRIENVPPGRITVKAMYMGYYPAILRDILVIPGKQVVLDIELEQQVLEMEEISVKGDPEFMPINDMATASARQFTVEETERYAGSRGDVARMASNYAGVSFANDARNDIIIRGNSPSFLLWRLEGVEVPNPNHFAFEGTTGGPVGMLNNNTLSNSDFITGAFPAEYGNALSGVFDLQMRSGNNENFEFLGQTGFNGFELGAEGPINKNSGSSFLANYRYSTLDVMDKLGMDFGTSGIPKYQDFSTKFALPMKNGRVEALGLWGTSEIAILDSEWDDKDFYSQQGTDLYNGSSLTVGGVTYTHFHDSKASSAFRLSGFRQKSWTDIYTIDSTVTRHFIDDDYIENRLSVDYVYNRKLNRKVSSQSGMTIDRMWFDLDGEIYNEEEKRFYQYFNNQRTIGNGTNFMRLYSQWKIKFTDAFTFNSGLHGSYFTLNQTPAIEPRLGVSYSLDPTKRFSLSYGLHSRLQPLSTYYYIDTVVGSHPDETNLDLGFTRAHHVVAGYDHRLSEHMRLKAEVYYQSLFNVPVAPFPSSYSILNTGSEFGIDLEENMVNEGTGKNYGVELTLERFLSHGFYYLLTASLFDSKYKGSDGIERSTQFDNDFVTNVLVGKEFQFNEKNAFFVDAKLAWAGGKRYTPIDLEASRQAGERKLINSKAYSRQHPDYFKLDIKIGYRRSSQNMTQEWQFYVENVTDRDNVLTRQFDENNGTVKTVYQLGIFPMMQYRIYF